jgi:hypothetical protein
MTVGYDRFRKCQCGGEGVLGFQEIHHQDGRYRLLSNGFLWRTHALAPRRGKNAFLRLQLEILKVSDDETIFARDHYHF